MTTVSARLGALARHHPWAVFCCRRAARLIVCLFVVVTGSFAMIRLVPGDPVRAALGVDAPPDLVAAKRHELGLDRGLSAQYRQYLRDLTHGDLGVSLVTGEPVADLVGARLPACTARSRAARSTTAALIGWTGAPGRAPCRPVSAPATRSLLATAATGTVLRTA